MYQEYEKRGKIFKRHFNKSVEKSIHYAEADHNPWIKQLPIVRLWDYEIVTLWDFEIFRFWDGGIVRFQIVRLWVCKFFCGNFKIL